MNGILLVNKPRGISSAGCVYKLRNILNTKKVGHCGTLDPLATGLLPICLGHATRFSSYITNLNKGYKLKAILGITSSTGDLEGDIIEEKEVDSEYLELPNIIQLFIGEQDQFPPMYSAIRRNGKPLYKWVREGIYFKREPRKVDIKSIKILSNSRSSFELEVFCSKGTYIRSLVESLGKHLEVGATMSKLERISIGPHSIDKSIPLDKITKSNVLAYLIPPDELILDIPSLSICSEDAKKVRKGQSVDYNAQLEIKGTVKIYEKERLFMGLGFLDENRILRPKRLFPN